MRGVARAAPAPPPQPQGPGTLEPLAPAPLGLALFSVAWGPQRSISAACESAVSPSRTQTPSPVTTEVPRGAEPVPGPTCAGGPRPCPSSGEPPHFHNQGEARGFASPGKLGKLVWGRSRQEGRVSLLSICIQLICSPKACSPPGSSAHRVFQVGMLQWVAIYFSRDLPDPAIKPASPAAQAGSLPLREQGWEERRLHRRRRA